MLYLSFFRTDIENESRLWLPWSKKLCSYFKKISVGYDTNASRGYITILSDRRALLRPLKHVCYISIPWRMKGRENERRITHAMFMLSSILRSWWREVQRLTKTNRMVLYFVAGIPLYNFLHFDKEGHLLMCFIAQNSVYRYAIICNLWWTIFNIRITIHLHLNIISLPWNKKTSSSIRWKNQHEDWSWFTQGSHHG